MRAFHHDHLGSTVSWKGQKSNSNRIHRIRILRPNSLASGNALQKVGDPDMACFNYMSNSIQQWVWLSKRFGTVQMTHPHHSHSPVTIAGQINSVWKGKPSAADQVNRSFSWKSFTFTWNQCCSTSLTDLSYSVATRQISFTSTVHRGIRRPLCHPGASWLQSPELPKRPPRRIDSAPDEISELLMVPDGSIAKATVRSYKHCNLLNDLCSVNIYIYIYIGVWVCV